MAAEVTKMEDYRDKDEAILADVAFCRDFIAKANRGIVKSYDNLKTFDETEHASEIKAMSHGMTIEEILDFYTVAWKNLSFEDQFFFCAMFLKGRANGTFAATQALFTQMRMRDGTKASLAYLSRFGSNWEDIENTSKKLDSQPKAIKIELID